MLFAVGDPNTSFPTTTIVPSSGFQDNALTAITSGAPDQVNSTLASGWTGTLMDLLKVGLQTWTLTEQQRAFMTVNQQRLANGLAPLDWQTFSPSANVSAGLDSQTRTMIYLIGGAAILALIFATRKRG